MQVFSLTPVGRSLSSTPISNPTSAMQVLYWMRRNGGQASDERIRGVAPDGEGSLIIKKLLDAKAIKVVG